MEALLAVDAGVLRGGPGCGVDCCCALGGSGTGLLGVVVVGGGLVGWVGLGGGGGGVLWLLLLFPVYHQTDRVFRALDAAQALRDAAAATRLDPGRAPAQRADHAGADVDVVAVQVVADVAVLAGPGFERRQLALRLAHVRVEVVEVS